MSKTFVGFGFGAIQTGLFLHEAQQSGHFGRFVISEVMAPVVRSLRENDGQCVIHIAHPDGIEAVTLKHLEVFNPNEAEDRRKLVEAISQADELATALPSVKFYAGGGAASVDALLAEGFAKFPNHARVVYCAENNNEAANILRGHLEERGGAEFLHQTAIVDTVIGKMSGVVTDADQMAEQSLAPLTPGADRAILVEAFNRILISEIGIPGFRRGIEVFDEKKDLAPFEEAKLYGHNATHALMAYLGWMKGIEFISDAPEELVEFARAAFIEESGGALIRKYEGVDPLFTPAGYQAYVDDLMVRMTNPHLRDTVERVGRDPERKLGWSDRIVGTMRVALSQGVEPRRYALAAAAGLAFAGKATPDQKAQSINIMALWQDDEVDPQEREAVVDRINEASGILRRWEEGGKKGMPEV